MAQFGHAGPGIEDVRDFMSPQAGEILTVEEFGIADFDGIAVFGRQIRKERVQFLQEFGCIEDSFSGKITEFKDDDRRAVAVGFRGAKKGILEQIRIEKRLVLDSGERSITRVAGKYLASDLFRGFEGESKTGRSLPEQPAPELFSRKLIKGEIAANGGKRLGVFLQTGFVEGFLREAAAGKIPGAAVNLAEPPFILPGTAADVDVAAGESFEARRELVAVE